jgi:hypothetical protein
MPPLLSSRDLRWAETITTARANSARAAPAQRLNVSQPFLHISCAWNLWWRQRPESNAAIGRCHARDAAHGGDVAGLAPAVVTDGRKDTAAVSVG